MKYATGKSFFRNVKKSQAFSLAEAMIMLLIAALILAATMPVITRKHLLLPTRGPHGKWVCTLINGVQHSATAANQSAAMPALDSGKWKPGCSFPILPSNVPYVLVQAVGGGAGGNTPGGPPTLNFVSMDDDYTIPDEEEGTLELPADGEYEISFAGRLGEKGTLNPPGMLFTVNGYIKDTCPYPGAEPDTSNASIRFKKEYKAGDQIWLRPVKNTRMTTTIKDCPQETSGGPHLMTGIFSDGTTMDITMDFSTYTKVPGKNGDDVYLMEKIYDTGAENVVAIIEGTSGGAYTNNLDPQGCNYLHCQRYIPVLRDYNTEGYQALVTKQPDNITAGSLEITPGGTGSNVNVTSVGVEIRGGCGGAPGSVNTAIFPRRHEEGEITVGKPGMSGENGGTTVFNYITAKGGRGCSSYTEIGFGDRIGYGSDGGEASTYTKTDSVAGKGGKGGYNLEQAGDGTDGGGFGSGGGGGGLAINMSKDEVKSAKGDDKETIMNKTTKGQGGMGGPGAIIISW